MIIERLMEALAIGFVGDGVVGLLQPRRHSRLWRSGPQPYREVMTTLVRRPGMIQLLSAGEVGLGLWLAARQRPRCSAPASPSQVAPNADSRR